MGLHQPLQYKAAQKACRAADGALVTLQDASSPYKFTEQAVLAALSNITYVSTLQEAYIRIGRQVPTSRWQLTPNCSSSSSSSSITEASDGWGTFSGNQQQQQQDGADTPTAPLLWWVDYQQQQQQGGSSSSSRCNALGAAEQGVVAGLACNMRLPFICASERQPCLNPAMTCTQCHRGPLHDVSMRSALLAHSHFECYTTGTLPVFRANDRLIGQPPNPSTFNHQLDSASDSMA
jgi:hypothetical protein